MYIALKRHYTSALRAQRGRLIAGFAIVPETIIVALVLVFGLATLIPYGLPKLGANGGGGTTQRRPRIIVVVAACWSFPDL